MLENKKLIIFDLDGTLIDSVGCWNKIDEETIKAIGGTLDKIKDIGKFRDKALAEFSKTGDAYTEYCAYLGKMFNSDLSKQKIKELRYDIARKILEENVDYKPYADEVLKFLKSKNINMVIASTTNDYTMYIYINENKNILSKAPMKMYFDKIYTKNSVQNLKPNPEIHLKIMEDYNLKPEECLVIEDSVIGLKAANSAGIPTVAMYDKYSDSSRDEIEKLAKYKFNDFKELLVALKKELKK